MDMEALLEEALMEVDVGGEGVNPEIKVNPSIKPESSARIVELAREHCTAEQWGGWLSIPLQLAAAAGDRELTEELVRAGASGDPVDAAIRGGQHDLVDRLLVQKPAEHSHLRLAASLGNEAIVSTLLRCGAEPDPSGAFLYDRQSSTPLLLAAKEGYAAIVGLLLDAGASAYRRLQTDEADGMGLGVCITVETESALDLAAIGGHVDVIRAITQREPSIVNETTAESTGYTALHYAAKHNQARSIDALAEAGANLEAQDDLHGGTALHAAVGSADCAATLHALLRRGANVDPVQHGNQTPLHLAVEVGNELAVKTLLSAGADPSVCLLSASVKPSSVDTICAFLRCGADVNVRRAGDGNTPLHLAAAVCVLATVDTLLRARADETAVNHRGLTPADVVGRQSGDHPHLEAIRTLLANAPRDRADRAWSRRGFFVLCRTFPERMRLPLAPCETAREDEVCTAASAAAATNGPVVSRTNKREATAVGGGGSSDSTHTDSVSAAFGAAMVRLFGLEMDVLFRTVVEFL